MKVVVTGGNGVLGGAAVRALAKRHEVLALGRGAARELPPGVAWREADLSDPRATFDAIAAFRPRAVLHCGAMTDVDACERDPGAARRVNAEGTAQVARACRETGARLVAVSTDYVFDGRSGPYSEDDAPNPQSAYARAKLEGEKAALELAPGCAVARVAVVYSARRTEKRTFARQVVELLSKGEPVKAFSDQRVSPTLASNGAAMLCELMLDRDYAGVLNVCGATVLDRVDFARRVARRFGLDESLVVPVLTSDVKLPAPRPLNGGLVVDRARRLLREQPLDADEQIDRFYRQWREQA